MLVWCGVEGVCWYGMKGCVDSPRHSYQSTIGPVLQPHIALITVIIAQWGWVVGGYGVRYSRVTKERVNRVNI